MLKYSSVQIWEAEENKCASWHSGKQCNHNTGMMRDYGTMAWSRDETSNTISDLTFHVRHRKKAVGRGGADYLSPAEMSAKAFTERGYSRIRSTKRDNFSTEQWQNKKMMKPRQKEKYTTTRNRVMSRALWIFAGDTDALVEVHRVGAGTKGGQPVCLSSLNLSNYLTTVWQTLEDTF